jgi:glycosyltransferase involved in cell wall biosynthesis
MIFIISRGYPSTNDPLNGIFELDQANALKNFGYNIVFVVLDFRSFRKKRKWGFFSRNINGMKCFHISFPLGNITHPIFNFIAKKVTWIGCEFLERDFGKPKLLHSHFFLISSLAIEIKKKFNVPLITTEHSSLINTEIVDKRTYSIANEVYNNSSLIISVSSALSKKIFSNFKVHSIVLPNIVNANVFYQSNDKSIKKIESEFVFVSVGTLTYNKGFDLLIKAFSLARLGNSVKLKIIGNGELFDELKLLALKLKIYEQIEFLGFLARDEIVKIFNTANAFVLASRGETFGLVYIEALISGLPIIATSCGGPEDFVNDSNGIIIPINDIDKLADSLKRMYNSYKTYDLASISEKAYNKYSPPIIAQELSNLYQLKFNLKY